jgi:MFS family permease
MRVPEYRAVWASLALSAVGDRVALVALTFLVYDRTRSPFLAAIAYAAGTIPYLFGGALLTGLADRFSRRAVMIACDLIRAALTVVMILPGIPLAWLIAILWAVGAAQPPFDAARAAVTRDILGRRLYPLGVAVSQMTFRAVLVGGASAGGLIVAVTSPRTALAADAVTFVVSALLVRFGLHPRPPAMAGPQAAAPPAGGSNPDGRRRANPGPGGAASGWRIIWRDRALRNIMLIGWLAAFYEVPEGIAAPYAAQIGGGDRTAGLLIASSQTMILAAPLYTRLAAKTRERWMRPMAIAACATLALTALHPNLTGSAVIFAVTGMFGAYQITANTAFVERTQQAQRARALGFAATGLVAGQGIAFAAAGWAARTLPPTTVITIAGGTGAIVACALTASWAEARPKPQGGHQLVGTNSP